MPLSAKPRVPQRHRAAPTALSCSGVALHCRITSQLMDMADSLALTATKDFLTRDRLGSVPLPLETARLIVGGSRVDRKGFHAPGCRPTGDMVAPSPIKPEARIPGESMQGLGQVLRW